ncbi:MAG: lipid A export permease/ATP-binding protein MsbA [Legionellaceae bacterium]|nr:lipid A export permease/ATP-binding protein MsbA [Legionellaceae bacterium]
MNSTTTKSHGKAGPLYKRLLSYVKPFWPVLLLGIVANIIYSIIDAGLTYMLRPFLDKGFINIDMTFVKQIPIIVLVGISIRGLVSSLGSYCMTWVARSVVNVLRQRVFGHIIQLPADYYDEATSGQLLSKILYDVEQVAQVSADALTDFVQNTCLVIGLLSVMMVICWQLSLMFLVTIPFIGLVVNVTNKRVRRISHRVQKTMGQVTEIASEIIDGYRVVRIFGGEQYEIDKFHRATETSRLNDMKVAINKAINVSSVQIIIAIGITTIIFAAIQLSTVIVVTAGSFLAIIAAMLQLIKPLKTLTTLNATIQRGLAGAESVFNLLDHHVESSEGQSIDPKLPCTIRFEDVSYAYREGPNVLHGINFSINAGETVALVGQSGSGKTTIASLLPRFYDVTSGQITLNNIPINTLSLASLRSCLAMVSQHVTLFNDTIANNIAYGRFDVSREHIMEAARLAYADEFIRALEHGYDTPVGDNGVLLSGGQRQRIAIARAILKDAPLLILDEATSALDNESEHYIQAALEHVMKNRTTLVIAHRLSTIKRADKIIVVHQGRVVELGSHQELLEQGGYYTKLYQTQYTQLDYDDVAARSIA